VQVTSVVTLSTHAKEDVSQSAEPDVLTEVRESVATGEPEFEESEERQASSDEFSGSADIDGDEQTDGFTEDAEAEVDVTGDESTQSTEPENNLAVIANEDGQSAASHGDAVEYDAQDAELATPAILLRGEYSEPTNTSHHHTDEDEENAESWELDDGYAVWDETFDGDEFDVAPAGEPDSVSSGSSTLSGKTASITSKRSFDEVDESEPTMEQSLSQNPKKHERDDARSARFSTTHRLRFSSIPSSSAPFITLAYYHIGSTSHRPSTFDTLSTAGFLTLLLLNAKYFMSVASNDSYRWYLS